MRWRTTIVLGMLSAAIALPDIAQAQLSPQGIIGGITRPFRQILGHLGRYPLVFIAIVQQLASLRRPRRQHHQMRPRLLQDYISAGQAPQSG